MRLGLPGKHLLKAARVSLLGDGSMIGGAPRRVGNLAMEAINARRRAGGCDWMWVDMGAWEHGPMPHGTFAWEHGPMPHARTGEGIFNFTLWPLGEYTGCWGYGGYPFVASPHRPPGLHRPSTSFPGVMTCHDLDWKGLVKGFYTAFSSSSLFFFPTASYSYFDLAGFGRVVFR